MSNTFFQGGEKLCREVFSHPGPKSQTFTVSIGLRQGCVPSPLLLAVCMNWIDSHNRAEVITESESTPTSLGLHLFCRSRNYE